MTKSWSKSNKCCKEVSENRAMKVSRFICALHCYCDTYWPCDLGWTPLSTQTLLMLESKLGALRTLLRCLSWRFWGFCMCMCMWCMWMCSCSCMQALCMRKDMCVEARDWHWVASSITLLDILIQDLSLNRRDHGVSSSLASQFVWLCLLGLGLQGGHLTFMWTLGSELWSSELPEECFTHWAISQLLNLQF